MQKMQVKQIQRWLKIVWFRCLSMPTPLACIVLFFKRKLRNHESTPPSLHKMGADV